jgi:hypothetical protein
MNRLTWVAFVTFFSLPTLTTAQSIFDGTWKVDLSTAKFPEKPDVYMLKDGMYQCKSCVPPIEVKADGQDQKVTGQPYFDSISVKVVDDRTLRSAIDKVVHARSRTSNIYVIRRPLPPGHRRHHLREVLERHGTGDDGEASRIQFPAGVGIQLKSIHHDV